MAGKQYDLADGVAQIIGGGVDGTAGITTIQITAISGATVTVRGSLDGGTTNTDLQLMPFGSSTGAANASATGAWRVDVAGIDQASILATGGTATVWVNNVNG